MRTVCSSSQPLSCSPACRPEPVGLIDVALEETVRQMQGGAAGGGLAAALAVPPQVALALAQSQQQVGNSRTIAQGRCALL